MSDTASPSTEPDGGDLAESPTAEPTGKVVEFSVPLKDVDGYTMDVDIQLSDFGVIADPTSESPGFTRVAYRFGSRVEVTNTSGAHAIDFAGFPGTTADGSYLTLQAVWDADSEVCSLPYRDAAPGSGRPCATTIGRFVALSEVGPGGSAELELAGPDGLGDYGIAGFPEDAFSELEPLLESPADFLLTYAGADKSRFNDGNCYRNIETGTAVVGSMSGVCPESVTFLRR